MPEARGTDLLNAGFWECALLVSDVQPQGYGRSQTMRRVQVIIGVVIFIVIAMTAFELRAATDPSTQSTPFMRTVEPASVKVGDLFTVNGDALDKSRVAALFLTDGKNDYKAEIVAQEASSIRAKVSAKTPVGRYALMVLLAGPDPKYIEQPVHIMVMGEVSGPGQ
jgi:hypothetical protein